MNWDLVMLGLLMIIPASFVIATIITAIQLRRKK
jgi:hypothetical protein